MTTFEKDLKNLLNRNCKENDSDTPDFLLAEYLVGCLELYSATVRKRETWYGRAPRCPEVCADATLPLRVHCESCMGTGIAPCLTCGRIGSVFGEPHGMDAATCPSPQHGMLPCLACSPDGPVPDKNIPRVSNSVLAEENGAADSYE